MTTQPLIALTFKPLFREALLSGRKTMTSRTKKYGKPGDQFEAFGGIFHLTEVRKKLLGGIAEHYFHQEGCDSPIHFQQVWKALHPRKGFDPEQEVYLHIFEKAELA